MPLSEDDVREILRLIDDSDLKELRIETDGLSLYVLRGNEAQGARKEVAESGPGIEPAEEVAPPPAPPPAAADDLLTIPAPMIGTFYRAPEPGAPPFVDVGTPVRPDTVVCIIEVMKLMNPVPAGVSGTIVEVCAENAHPVEYGDPLFRVQPNGQP